MNYIERNSYSVQTNKQINLSSNTRQTVAMFLFLAAATSFQASATNISVESFNKKSSGSNTFITAPNTKKNKSQLDVRDGLNSSNLDIDQMPTFVKESFGLNHSDLAKIFKVSRPTIYKYLDGNGPTDQATIDHITFICELAVKWSNITQSPINRDLKRVYPENNMSLFDMLLEANVNRKAVETRVEYLAKINRDRYERALVKNTTPPLESNIENYIQMAV